MKFAYDSFPVSERQALLVREVRANFSNLSEWISDNLSQGRYLSLVETKLEEACMFAIKSITHQAGQYDEVAK